MSNTRDVLALVQAVFFDFEDNSVAAAALSDLAREEGFAHLADRLAKFHAKPEYKCKVEIGHEAYIVEVDLDHLTREAASRAERTRNGKSLTYMGAIRSRRLKVDEEE